jgi:hypothetical protein
MWGQPPGPLFKMRASGGPGNGNVRLNPRGLALRSFSLDGIRVLLQVTVEWTILGVVWVLGTYH